VLNRCHYNVLRGSPKQANEGHLKTANDSDAQDVNRDETPNTAPSSSAMSCKKQQFIALERRGRTLRRIEQSTGVRREIVGAYLKAAGIALRVPSGGSRRLITPAGGLLADASAPKPANEMTADPGGKSA
jgi:hypothetical protein